MKKLTAEEAGNIPLKGPGNSSHIFNALINMKEGESLLIEPFAKLQYCHSERSEESLLSERIEMFRYAQHDIKGGFAKGSDRAEGLETETKSLLQGVLCNEDAQNHEIYLRGCRRRKRLAGEKNEMIFCPFPRIANL